MSPQYWKVAQYRPLDLETFKRRFEQKYAVDEATGCWVWQGTRNKRGQGLMSDGVRQQKAHKLAYLYFVCGEIPPMHYVAQTCKNVACVNPAHLTVRRAGAASKEGNSPFAQNARKTHCIHGHEFTEANTIVYRGRRRCGTCQDRRRKRPKHTDERKLLEDVRRRFSDVEIAKRVWEERDDDL